ncbi:HlyD family efflux transporter periplasmic adaptor subunit [Thalassotalea psychrophila]|uniref:HlyD family efflux transporter periplasmic adaptor subunit n=1 Tax=Thalassotalea psychrophila TaxID=3065647 RepID=A0ABY9TWQ4_9GAMM|nr:HlyD family efflux transporter periplasmic adaptor subunit [Colwelliaceae bacterium SQ149]
MNIKTILMAVMANISLLTSTVVFASGDHSEKSEQHQQGEEQHQEAQKGPNNGRLLIDGDFSLELVLFEGGSKPEYRVFANNNHQQLDPKTVAVDITLTRLGDIKDTVNFSPKNNYLKGDVVIYEPHSFIVNVNASYTGKNYSWHFESLEGRTQISHEMAVDMGVETSIVAAKMLTATVPVFGQLTLTPNSQRFISARYPGEVVQLNVELGQVVKKGQHLLTIRSNESLQSYKVYAPISGVVSRQNTGIGQQTNSDVLLAIINTNALMAELNVYPSEQPKVKIGAEVELSITGVEQTISGQIMDSLTMVNAQQAKIYRVKVDNSQGHFTVGQFVEADIAVSSFQADMAVNADALQSFRDFTVVYEKVGDEYEVRMLKLGRKAGNWVEVISGIKAGSEYVSGNSYLIKADIDKAGASHDH